MSELKDQISDLPKGKGLDSRWFTDDKTPEDKEKTKEILVNATFIFRRQKKILEDIFKNKKLKPVDFDKPTLDQRVYYNEGYKQALQDIYRTLP